MDDSLIEKYENSSKGKITCHQNLISSMIHRKTYSHKVTTISNW